MNAIAPVVDLASKTVTHAGTTFVIRPLAEDTFTVLVAGVPVGRVVYTFGAANGVAETEPGHEPVSEDVLTAIAEVWFAALESAESAES